MKVDNNIKAEAREQYDQAAEVLKKALIEREKNKRRVLNEITRNERIVTIFERRK